MTDSIETWLRTLGQNLKSLPVKAQADILTEVRAHLTDRLEQGYTTEQALKGFGDAAVFARRFRADTTLEDAMAPDHVRAVLGGLITTIGRSLTAAFALVSVGVCVLLACRVAVSFAETHGWGAIDNLPVAIPASVAALALLWGIAKLSLKLAITSLRLEPLQ